MPKTKIQSIVFTAMRVFCMFMFPDSTFTANIFYGSICTSDVQKCIQWRRDGVPESDGQQDCQYIGGQTGGCMGLSDGKIQRI